MPPPRGKGRFSKDKRPKRNQQSLLFRRKRFCRFTVAGVTELLGPMAAAALDREQSLPAQRATAASDAPCATLIRLFTLGDPVDVAEAVAVAEWPGRVTDLTDRTTIPQLIWLMRRAAFTVSGSPAAQRTSSRLTPMSRSM